MSVVAVCTVLMLLELCQVLFAAFAHGLLPPICCCTLYFADYLYWQVMRITPRLNEHINEEWLSDKGRFSYDGLKRQRLNIPLVKTSEGFQTVLWPDALKAIAEGLKGVKGSEMKAIAGKLADAEAMVALKVSSSAALHKYNSGASLLACQFPACLSCIAFCGLHNVDHGSGLHVLE